jgi:DivIVA domain-containing protein
MVLLTIAVVAGVAAVVAGVVSGGLGEPASPIPARALPTGPLTGQDVADLRFVQAFRGYRMDQVDAAMDSLASEVDRLRGQLAAARAAGSRPSVPSTSGTGWSLAKDDDPLPADEARDEKQQITTTDLSRD